MPEKLFVDLHVIHNLPPNCINRDDTGSPKTALYGGARRARVSSQSWKRAARLAFNKAFSGQNFGVRTKKIVAMVAEAMAARDASKPENERMELAEKIVNAAGVSTKDQEAKALFFMSSWQARNLAELALGVSFDKENDKKNKELAQAALNKDHSVDIALFGRMVADSPELNCEASAQVAHAISTHRVENEYDYFTAVDDRAPEDTAGAGMLGTVEFNSATLYRYATVAAHELRRNLGDAGAAAEAVAEFAMAFITAMPTGKENTFAHHAPPWAVLAALRTDQPVNLAGAFETPVRETGGGYAPASVKALRDYAAYVYENFAPGPARTLVIGPDLEGVGEKVTLAALRDILADEARQRL